MKKAFTLLELVFVIVVIGIISAAVIPRTNSSNLSEQTVDLISKIRYTQHLAMIDDKFDATVGSNWMRNRWQIVFSGTNNTEYSIVSDIDTVYAVDPQSRVATIEDIELEGITSVVLTGGCANATDITFDYLGRPMVGDISDDTTALVSGQILTATCVITLTDDNGDTAEINIEPETGYTHRILP